MTPTKGVKKQFSTQPPDSWTGFNFSHSPQKLLGCCYVLTCCEAGDVKRQASSQGQVELRIVGGKQPCSRTAGCLLICARTNRRNTDTPQLGTIIIVHVSAQTVKKDSRKLEWGPDLKLASVNHLWDEAYRCTPPSSHHMANALPLSQEEDPPGDRPSSHQ